MNNKLNNLFTDSKYLSKFIGHMSAAALEVNKTQVETSSDFFTSKRTGQSAISIQRGLIRVGAHYIPDSDTEEKIRYTIVANNKVNFLLENPDRIDTFPKNEQEYAEFPLRKIFGGGVLLDDEISAISGYYPRVDEASNLVFRVEHMDFISDAKKIRHCMLFSKKFNNPYVLAISAGSNFTKGFSFDQAIEWGKNEILKM